ncbi:MAG: glycosyltransferase family 2 protein [Acidobacteria bacterium]|nr:MAG: glycosyltransferase family 2 protein [Acidobacteriota bacterium]
MGSSPGVSAACHLCLSGRSAGVRLWPGCNRYDRGKEEVKPKISVIVVNLDRRELLARCLDSLWRQLFSDFEVIVVDNGSHDGSLEFLNGISEPRLRVVSLPSNNGFAGGCNAGIRVAKGRYIATLNNDAEADQRWLEELVAGMESDDSIGMCASKILFYNDRKRIDKAGHLIYPDGLNHGRGSGEPDRGQFDQSEEVLFPDAAAALYRREMLEVIGLFDEHFFAYGDDADLGLRGRLAGWRCLYIPAAIVYHVHSATAGEFSPLKAFLIERNRIFVAVKVFPLSLLLISPFFTVLRLAYQAYGSIFMIGSSGQYAAGCSHSRLALMMLKAYWSGLKLFPEMWRSRRKIRRFARLTDRDFAELLRRHRISLRALTLGT